jgi:hypothetical protein
MAGDGMFDPIEPSGTPQAAAEEWRPLPPPTEATPADLRHPKLGEPSETWAYRNKAGLLEGYVSRFATVQPDGTPGKEFRPRRYGTLVKQGKARTGWHWRGWGENRPLYGLGELLARTDAVVIITEGERTADAAQRLFPEHVAVSPMNGAKSPHKTDWTPVAGRRLIIWPDNDAAGLGFARKCARLAAAVRAASAAIVAMPKGWPDSWDLADKPPNGVGVGFLAGMLASAVPVSPDPASDPTRSAKPASEAEIGAAVQRLAALSSISYEIERKDEANRLGIEVPAVDRLVKQARRESDAAGSPGQGRPVEFAELAPWLAAVDGAALLDEIAAALRRYVIISDAAADAVALWLVRTHAHDAFDFNPLLIVKSVEKRSGKSRLCEAAERVAARALMISSLTASALLRVIETHRPALILDEMDALMGRAPELTEAVRGLINSGFKRSGARHLLSVPSPGGGYDVRSFSMWAPLMLSGIGTLKDTIIDRSIVVEMKRKRRDERVARLSQRDGQDLNDLARKAARWASGHSEALGNARPKMPEWLNDRAVDAWEPLFAIAELAGARCRNRAEAAARALSGDEAVEDDSIRVKLLADIRHAFGERDRLSSEEIVTYLTGLEERPWAEWGKQSKPISKNQVADLLRPLRITPKTVNFGRHQGKRDARGYHLSAFKDAFSRYLPLPAVSTITPSPTQDFFGLEADSGTSPKLASDGLQDPRNPGVSAKGDGVTVQNPETAQCEGVRHDSNGSHDPLRTPGEGPSDRPKRGRITL